MYDEAAFQAALGQPRLREPVPAYLAPNRAVPIRTLQEDELQAMTRQWFSDFEEKLGFYNSRVGLDLDWLMEWSKKYWWSWIALDMDHNEELYTKDLRYTDVSAFGHTIQGLDEFVTYNMAFFEAIPDWRYDPIPEQVYLDVTPDGRVRMVVRYLGSGHWDGPLRFHPYDDSAPAIYGGGQFLQAPAVDRYHFNSDGLMEVGETLYDLVDGMQRAGVVPRGDSWQFRAIAGASRVPGITRDIKSRVRDSLRAPVSS